jgi:hypothetical protein
MTQEIGWEKANLSSWDGPWRGYNSLIMMLRKWAVVP